MAKTQGSPIFHSWVGVVKIDPIPKEPTRGTYPCQGNHHYFTLDSARCTCGRVERVSLTIAGWVYEDTVAGAKVTAV